MTDYERGVLESVKRGLPLSKTKPSFNIITLHLVKLLLRNAVLLQKIAFWFHFRFTLLPNLFGFWVVLFLNTCPHFKAC